MFSVLVQTGINVTVWTSLDKFGQVWTSLDKFGQVWTSSEKFGKVWRGLKELRRV